MSPAGRTAPAAAGGVARSAGEGSWLQAATDPRWFDVAVERWQELLLDHANCEKKAASTALAPLQPLLDHLLAKHPEHRPPSATAIVARIDELLQSAAA
jgi:tRNA isopentenyl-2-thiomethyl-A-37 hydroxylase MiaE